MALEKWILLGAVLALASCKPASERERALPSASARTVPNGPAATPEIELVQATSNAKLDANATRVLVARVDKALGVCNFTSRERPEIFGGKDLNELWKEREGGPHLRIRYAEPKSIDAVAGKLVFREALLSIGQPYGPEPALVKDDAVLGLKKCGYDDRLLGCDPALEPYFAKPAQCPPGY